MDNFGCPLEDAFLVNSDIKIKKNKKTKQYKLMNADDRIKLNKFDQTFVNDQLRRNHIQSFDNQFKRYDNYKEPEESKNILELSDNEYELFKKYQRERYNSDSNNNNANN